MVENKLIAYVDNMKIGELSSITLTDSVEVFPEQLTGSSDSKITCRKGNRQVVGVLVFEDKDLKIFENLGSRRFDLTVMGVNDNGDASMLTVFAAWVASSLSDLPKITFSALAISPWKPVLAE